MGTGPELPERVEAAWRRLELERELIEPDAVEEKHLLKVHSRSFVKAVKDLDFKARTLAQYTAIMDRKKKYRKMVDGTCIIRGSFTAALYACGATLEAVQGGYEAAYALIRPPGHHSHRSFTHGFCIFNNTCVALENWNKGRTLIVDLDLHFGDGVYFFFKGERNIRYLSFAHIRLDGKLFPRPSIERLNHLASSLDPDLLYLIMGYDALDFGYTEPQNFFRLLAAVLRHATGRRVIMELSGGYDVQTIGDYVKKSLKMLDEAV